MSTAGSALLVMTSALPLALALLALFRSLRGPLMRMLPLAPLPGLGAALLAPRDEIVALPDLLLGVGLSIDRLDAVFLGSASLLWITAGAYARRYIGIEKKAGGFAGFWLLTLAGNLGVFAAVDVVTFYIAFSFLSLAAFALVIHDDTPAAHRAGRVYIVLAVVGEICLLLAFMIGAAAAGSLLIDDVSAGLATSPWRALGLLLLTAGFGLKAGLVPLHVWLPLAHPVAPTPASAVLSGAIVNAGVFGLMRFLSPDAAGAAWGEALIVAGLGTSYFGILVGLTQSNPKTVLAYSTLSQMGLVMAVIGAGLGLPASEDAQAAATLYAAHHGLAKGALFLGVGVIAASGAAARRVAMVPMVVMALAIAGLPLTGGALAKLAVKAPLGNGAASLLATFSAVGTTLVMLRFLLVSWRAASPSPDAVPGRGLIAPWIATAIAAVAIPFALFSELLGRSALYSLTPANLWNALWPIALGTAVALLAVRFWRRGPPAIPEGDLVVIGEAAVKAALGARKRAQWPRIDATRVRAWSTENLPRAAARVDAALRRWPVAGTALLVVAALIGLALAV